MALSNKIIDKSFKLVRVTRCRLYDIRDFQQDFIFFLFLAEFMLTVLSSGYDPLLELTGGVRYRYKPGVSASHSFPPSSLRLLMGLSWMVMCLLF